MVGSKYRCSVSYKASRGRQLLLAGRWGGKGEGRSGGGGRREWERGKEGVEEGGSGGGGREEGRELA